MPGADCVRLRLMDYGKWVARDNEYLGAGLRHAALENLLSIDLK